MGSLASQPSSTPRAVWGGHRESAEQEPFRALSSCFSSGLCDLQQVHSPPRYLLRYISFLTREIPGQRISSPQTSRTCEEGRLPRAVGTPGGSFIAGLGYLRGSSWQHIGFLQGNAWNASDFSIFIAALILLSWGPASCFRAAPAWCFALELTRVLSFDLSDSIHIWTQLMN